MIDRILLFPYYWVLNLRRKYYGRQGRRFHVTDVPSLCIGNVTAGGTGKTPMVELVLRTLLESEEWKNSNIAVLSRGYKRESKGFQQVVTDGAATMFGDEPLQIKKKFPSVTVVVDKNRVEACNILQNPKILESGRKARGCWHKQLPPADYIVLDDAFQYRKLKTRGTIVLVDYNRPVFNDMLLPLGGLRDLPERVTEADVVVVTKCPPSGLPDQERITFAGRLGISDYSAGTFKGKTPAGRSITLLFARISYGTPLPVYPVAEVRYVYSKTVILVSGIARDTPMRDYLSDNYRIVKRMRFPDHHKFRWSDIDRIQRAIRKHPTTPIVTTEKDAQRLQDFPGMPEEIMERIFTLPIKTEFLSDEERKLFEEYVTGL